MNLKRFLSSAMALTIVASAMSVTSVFAASPTFKVSDPIDALTGETVTEFKAGQIIEVPVDIENVDSGKLAMCQLGMVYDNTIFNPGIDTTNEGTDGFTYYDTYGETAFAMSPQDEPNEIYKTVYRNNLTVSRGAKPALSGNLYAYENEIRMLWNITGANSIAVNAAEPEFFICFTVKDDFDPANFELNKTSSLTITNENDNFTRTTDGLFALNALYVDETATTNHRNLEGTNTTAKVNACYGAFTVSVDDAALEAQKIWVTGLKAVIEGKEYPLTEYVNADGSTVYAFPTRIVTNNANATSAEVTIVADTNTKEDESGTASTMELAKKTISLTGTVKDYE